MRSIIKNVKYYITLLGETYSELLDDKGFKMAAALSYYSAFSLSPVLIIMIAIAGIFFGEESARNQIVAQVGSLMGKDSAVVVETMIKGASQTSTGIFAAIIAIILLVMGSLGVFLELQESLNIIWGVEFRPGKGLWLFIRNRLVSFSMVLATGFLMVVSLVLNSLVSLLSNFMVGMFSWLLPLVKILDNLLSFAVITVLFTLIFKYLPDIILTWRQVVRGAIITSALFTIGKYLIGLYLGNNSYASTYGAAASLVILFIWIYYSGLILYFGAEFTQVFIRKHTKIPLMADKNAVLVPKVSQSIKEAIAKGKTYDDNKDNH